MIILDTNVVSELMRPAPNPRVREWMDGVETAELFITAITEAELRAGVAIVPQGRRRTQLEAELEANLAPAFHERVLPFDRAAARAYGEVVAARRAAGRSVTVADAMIAAIAKTFAATVATRDLGGFEGCGLALIDPWTA